MSESPAAVELLERLCAPPGDRLPPPRTLFVLAHPDDETVGASSRLTRAEVAALVYATDGAPCDGHDARAAECETIEAYAQTRRSETLRALAHAGISSERAVFLDYPDQKAAFNLLPLTADLHRWILRTHPEIVLTHPYEGGHPDHDAVAFAVHAAVTTLARERHANPTVIEFTSYHACGEGWTFAEFLPAPEATEERIIQLNADAQALKQRLLACHQSQVRTLSAVPVDRERFRIAPNYDFTRPPHAGQVLYERYDWGLTIDAWCALAADATERLQKSQAAGV
jgi:LmbE family N-acetylglucosaminyl deacetylase